MKQTYLTLRGLALIFMLWSVTANAAYPLPKRAIDPLHRKVITAWFDANPKWRLAVESDFDFGEKAKERFGKDFLPYYLAYDFNLDRKEDFAAIFVGKDGKKFGVAVFLSPMTAKDPNPAFFSDQLERGDGLFLYSPAKVGSEKVLIGPADSDNLLVLKFKKGKFSLEPF